jgi:hypothetical protein
MVQLKDQQSKTIFGKGMLLLTLLMSLISVSNASYAGEVKSNQFIKPIGSTWTKLDSDYVGEVSPHRLE